MTPLAQTLSLLAKEECYNKTHIPGVGVFKASESREREPLCYSQGIFIVAQSAKRIYLEQQAYDYNPDNYLVLTLPIPAECETSIVDDKPLLSMLVDIDISLLHPLVRLFDQHQQATDSNRNFRYMTSSSSIQYLKKLRLSRARELLQDHGVRVKQAAAEVGYESPTQFSREFKRYFGLTPQACAAA
ncbi:AraC family transcriptional regulator [Endozoicomonas sp. YOMI1]|uniref:AraC family transcriptional regulator n=1 Tax=Endozoicomonas sp. YOMI1 TaxID=2828739 RepID=UPI00214877B4|nr:AraC family transcriptional regulator [Endozoicomonas sp. YOMI1]